MGTSRSSHRDDDYTDPAAPSGRRRRHRNELPRRASERDEDVRRCPSRGRRLFEGDLVDYCGNDGIWNLARVCQVVRLNGQYFDGFWIVVGSGPIGPSTDSIKQLKAGVGWRKMKKGSRFVDLNTREGRARLAAAGRHSSTQQTLARVCRREARSFLFCLHPRLGAQASTSGLPKEIVILICLYLLPDLAGVAGGGAQADESLKSLLLSILEQPGRVASADGVDGWRHRQWLRLLPFSSLRSNALLAGGCHGSASCSAGGVAP